MSGDAGGPPPFLDPASVQALVDDGMVLFAALEGPGTIAWIGEASRTILGRSPAEMTGRSCFDFIHPDDIDVVVETLAEAARGADGRILLTMRLVRADGTSVRLEFGGLDRRDEAGEGVFLVWGRSAESHERLVGFLASLLGRHDLPELLAEVLRWSDTVSYHGCSALLLTPPPGAAPRIVARADLPPALGVDLDRATFAPAVEAATTGRVVEVAADDLPPDQARTARDHGFVAVWAVPLEGLAGAVLVVWRRRPGPTLATHRRHFGEVAQLTRLAVEWWEARDELERQARTDPLTGLANRAALSEVIEAAGPGLAALLVCDLDGFKAVNDVHGHLAGDRALLVVAERLRASVRPDDVVVRLGGDEFAIWCPALPAPAVAEEVAERVVAALDRPLAVRGSEVRVGASVGVAWVERPLRGDAEVEDVLSRADGALYAAKRDGGRRWASAAPGGRPTALDGGPTGPG